MTESKFYTYHYIARNEESEKKFQAFSIKHHTAMLF